MLPWWPTLKRVEESSSPASTMSCSASHSASPVNRNDVSPYTTRTTSDRSFILSYAFAGERNVAVALPTVAPAHDTLIRNLDVLGTEQPRIDHCVRMYCLVPDAFLCAHHRSPALHGLFQNRPFFFVWQHVLGNYRNKAAYDLIALFAGNIHRGQFRPESP